ncbi:2-oxoglutarate-Fe(II) type oxidoreductase-like isoform X2 [Phalaenopsis equestris]|uniref:2-oxoglutarate-Fe(II) type oxidoreductase-like isoform X2 n=1 Tax=Phalaenopsis equestris TaxID=78828 RepID=UPI0009E59462|nr:2-oxoglutarate-Fe(II) type oxidoreductase-like isoform X2 [Phalaenopsis equestris]
MLGDFKEGYCIGIEVSEEDSHAEKPFYGPNQWPSEEFLPGWRQVMEQYQIEALRVCRTIAKFISLALDLEADYFDQPQMLGEPIAAIRLLHYEGKVSDPERGIFGCGAHSDFGLITLLATDGVAGLQICKDKDAQPRIWESVAPLKGSTLHRVVVDGQERYSIAFFVNPSHDYLVECLPSCTSEMNPPRHPPITCAAFISQRYKDTHPDLSS